MRLTDMLLHSLPRNNTLGDEDVNKTLERFHVFLGQQVIVHGDGDEVDKAAVEVKVAVDVPERMIPVAMVQMSVASEHLLDDTLDILVEVLGEPG